MGIATGCVFKIWALVVISPLIAVFSAIILRAYEFGMMAGVIVIAICLAVCGEPGETGEQKIHREHK
ncbi:hypothetical protein WN73_34385 [Bradyrhizobium sp. CCBAU 45394]|nr:hypothetical protein [Bradyrhizobium sp. CCBAU 45394]